MGIDSVRERLWERLNARIANKYRDKLIRLYGKEKESRFQYTEAFELCEYGTQPTEEELKALFLIK